MAIVCEIATVGNEIDIFSIANSVKKPETQTANIEEQGFLLFVKSIKEYRRRIEASDICLLAKSGDKYVGFLMACDEAAIKKLGKETDPIIQEILKYEKDNNLVYIDQIAVVPNYQSSGVAQQMLDYLMTAKPQGYFITAIAEKPALNKRSIKFFLEKNHWRRVRQMWIGDIMLGTYKNR